MEIVLVLIVLGALLAGLITLGKVFSRKRSTAKEEIFPGLPSTPPGKLPYEKKWYLLSQAERSFYEILLKVAGNDMHVFAKVRLLDLLWVPNHVNNRQSHLNRVMSKHVDFVLCNRRTVSPVLVLELDDSSHRMIERRERDLFVNEVLRTAGLHVLRVPVRRSYTLDEVAELIRKEIGGAGTTNPTGKGGG